MAWYQGPSRITVTAVEGRWPQRAVVTVRGGAPVEVPGEVGAVHVVDAESWQLDLEHRHEGEWCPNIRAVQGRWEEVRGVPTQVVHSRNRDLADDRRDRNLVLRIERTTPGGGRPSAGAAPTALRTTAAHRTPAAPAVPRTSAGGTAGSQGVRTTTSGGGAAVQRPAAPGAGGTTTGGAARPTTSTTSWSG
ncbi:hypothetical protein [Streptomyces sp. CBMA156]|uniref:hypothetical protein n=1 Tax=Streptomyces sp. CBMA156 TaxID=1930280 RepID=UPI001661DC92|nr:hypothetical protein [Streptomyces sp. CBMA156]MBD0676454.1 hypothetical protein [Streptomyces sp. CBMA156]